MGHEFCICLLVPQTAVCVCRVHRGICCLQHWCSNSNMHGNHLESMLKHRFPNWTPRDSDSVNLGWGPCAFFKRFYLFIYLFLEGRGREGEREGENHQCVVASWVSPTRDLGQSPGMCPDWESNWQPFGSQAGTQSTEPHQPGPMCFFFFVL